MVAQDIEVCHIEGYCPFFCCVKTEPHDHSICPECGAVRHGNMFCETCRAYSKTEASHLEDGRMPDGSLPDA
jgi:hypothetical protein